MSQFQYLRKIILFRLSKFSIPLFKFVFEGYHLEWKEVFLNGLSGFSIQMQDFSIRFVIKLADTTNCYALSMTKTDKSNDSLFWIAKVNW